MNTRPSTTSNLGAHLTSEEIVAMHAQYGANHYNTDPTFIPDHGNGVWVWDRDGRRYLDMNATYSAIALGHGNRELADAIYQQLLRITSTQNKYPTEVQSLLLKRICEITGQDKTILMNTGAEIVDTAVKAARRWAYHKGVCPDSAEIISAENNFHGRTLNAIGMSTVAEYRKDFGPFLPGYVHVPFGDCKALNEVMGRQTAAFIVEPIQGEGGINIPPAHYLKHVRRLCDIYGVLLIFDEVQTGLGRTGKLFASEWYGVKPDAVLLGKALGEYIAVSAMAGRKELMDVFTPGSHGSTFGGNPVACAAALKSIEMITRNDCAVVKNANVVGSYLLQQLRHAGLHARGKGLLVGVQLNPKKMTASDACHKLLESGIIAGAASNNVVRFSPALIFTEADVDFAMPHLVKVLE